MKKIYMFLLLMSAMFFVSCNQDAFIKSVKVPVSGSTTGGTSGGTGGTTGGGIDIIYPAGISGVTLSTSTLSLTGEITITFNYNSAEETDIYVDIKKDGTSDDVWTWYTGTSFKSTSGNGTKTAKLSLADAATKPPVGLGTIVEIKMATKGTYNEVKDGYKKQSIEIIK